MALDQFVDKRYRYSPGNVRFTTRCIGCRTGHGGSATSPDDNLSILELRLWLAGRDDGAEARSRTRARPIRPEEPPNNDTDKMGGKDGALAGPLDVDDDVSC